MKFRSPVYSLIFFAVATQITGCAGLFGSASLPEANSSAPAKYRKNSVPVELVSTSEVKFPRFENVSLKENAEVRKEIAEYKDIRRKQMANAVANHGVLDNTIAPILASQGVPPMLASVAVVESSLNNYAVSPAGAKGMWQFTKGTALMYGLEISKNFDERNDSDLSTIAAGKFLSDLFKIFKDWNLALAAYNAGPARISRIIKESGTNDFWELSRAGKLPQETTDYVPRVLAASIIMNNPEEHGFEDSMIG